MKIVSTFSYSILNYVKNELTFEKFFPVIAEALESPYFINFVNVISTSSKVAAIFSNLSL